MKILKQRKKKIQKSYNLKNKKILEKLVILNKIKKNWKIKILKKNERFEKIAISKDMKNWDIWNIEYFRKQKILTLIGAGFFGS